LVLQYAARSRLELLELRAHYKTAAFQNFVNGRINLILYAVILADVAIEPNFH